MFITVALVLDLLGLPRFLLEAVIVKIINSSPVEDPFQCDAKLRALISATREYENFADPCIYQVVFVATVCLIATIQNKNKPNADINDAESAGYSDEDET